MNSHIQAARSALRQTFELTADPPPPPAKKTAPFSVRLTPEEKAFLLSQAGNKPLGAFMREKLLADMNEPRRSYRKPIGNEPLLSALLAQLGKTHIASNLNQLSRSANMGTLDVSEDVEQQLKDACGALIEMREVLFIALGLKKTGSEK
jgi:hypothetical protein